MLLVLPKILQQQVLYLWFYQRFYSFYQRYYSKSCNVSGSTKDSTASIKDTTASLVMSLVLPKIIQQVLSCLWFYHRLYSKSCSAPGSTKDYTASPVVLLVLPKILQQQVLYLWFYQRYRAAASLVLSLVLPTYCSQSCRISGSTKDTTASLVLSIRVLPKTVHLKL